MKKKKLSISNELMTLVLKKSVSALSNVTVYDLHFALVHMETDTKVNEIRLLLL